MQAVNWKALARAGRKVRVEMVRGVVGEDAAEWHPGEVHEATPLFGKWLVEKGKARLAAEAKPAPASASEPEPEDAETDEAPRRTRRGRRK